MPFFETPDLPVCVERPELFECVPLFFDCAIPSKSNSWYFGCLVAIDKQICWTSDGFFALIMSTTLTSLYCVSSISTVATLFLNLIYCLTRSSVSRTKHALNTVTVFTVV